MICRSLATWVKVRQFKGKAGEDERFLTVYNKEAELLTKHISEPLRQHNVILSHENLRLLAILHESLVSFNAGVMRCLMVSIGCRTGSVVVSNK